MMRRIELLPQAHLEQRRQRRVTAGVVIVGLVALTMLIGYWLVLGMQVADERNELAQVTARNQQLQAEIDELQRFADMEAELKAKEASLATVTKGDVDWPGLLTEIAMVLPSEVWLTNLTASAGQTEGATQVGTETAPVRVSEEEPFGRIQFQGNSLEMTGVPKWLIRLGTVKEFNALWLNSADKSEGTTEGAPDIVTFDSTLELGDEAASDRFQEETP
jgi:Tfp pilus assembly protein PilN